MILDYIVLSLSASGLEDRKDGSFLLVDLQEYSVIIGVIQIDA
jgi:hypothetical protein